MAGLGKQVPPKWAKYSFSDCAIRLLFPEQKKPSIGCQKVLVYISWPPIRTTQSAGSSSRSDRQHHCVQQQLQSMAHLQAARVQLRVRDSNQQLALVFQRIERGQNLDTFQFQDIARLVTCGTLTFQQPLPFQVQWVGSLTRHMTTVYSPTNPSYLTTRQWPINDITQLRTDPTFENIAVKSTWRDRSSNRTL